MSKSLRIRLLNCFLYISILTLIFDEVVESKGNKKNRKLSDSNKQQKVKAKPRRMDAKAPGGIREDHTTGLYFCLFLFILCIVPSIIAFVYNIVRDPITPTLISNASALIKANTLSYLSKSKSSLHNTKKS